MPFDERIPRPDLRHRRAMSLTAMVMRIVDDHTRDIRDDSRFLRKINDALMDAFMADGVDILNDFDRERMGLPPRGPDGWTVEEILALDQRRLDAMRADVAPVIISK